jgi:hypothetical protein
MKKQQVVSVCLWSSSDRDYPVYTEKSPLANGMADFASPDDEPVLALDGIPYVGSEICLSAYEVSDSGIKVRVGQIAIAPSKLKATHAPAAAVDDTFATRAVKNFTSPRNYARAEFRHGKVAFAFGYLLKKYTENHKEMCQLLIKEITVFIG